MLVSELPSTATVVSPGVWTDSFSQRRFVLDLNDSTLLLARGWTPKEVADYNQAQAVLGTNQAALTKALTDSLAGLVTDIGLLQSDPALVKDSSSLNGILKSTPASINADPSVYIIALAKYIKRCDKAVIAAGKIVTSAFTDASTGQ